MDNTESVYPRSHRLTRRLSAVYSVCVLAVVGLVLLAWLPAGIATPTRALAHEAIAGGLAATVLAALLLSLTGLVATLALTTARFRQGLALEAGRAAAGTDWRQVLNHAGVAARIGQAVILPLGAILIYLALRLLWPYEPVADGSSSANVLAALVFGLAFVSLVCERVMAAFPEPQLPEAPALRRLLLLTTLLLGIAACVELGRATSLAWVRWPQYVTAILPMLVVLELALRALARLFLPAPPAATARSVTDSILAGVITGGPRAPGTLLKTHLGLDFARSWALSFLSAAILPALFGTALFCWALTGLKLIELGQRGIYERFGAPVAVLGTGPASAAALAARATAAGGVRHHPHRGDRCRRTGRAGRDRTGRRRGCSAGQPESAVGERACGTGPTIWWRAPAPASRDFKASVPRSACCIASV